MNPEDYALQQALISSAVINYVLTFAKYFVSPALTVADWLKVLSLLYPEVAQRREEAAELARRFYDSQRELEHPDLPAVARKLVPYEYKWFVQNMEPARVKMSQEESPADAVTTLALRAVREVENAGRRQIIGAVQDDPETKIIRGWARVATGRETCAWCLMLISRGPVYLGADTAGLDLPDNVATRMIAAGEDVSEYMEQWHDGCDCKVVPVFKGEGWYGEAAANRALELWNEATLEAHRIHDSDPTKHPSGKNKGKTMTLNQEALNALRRKLARGEIDPSEFAALAAA